MTRHERPATATAVPRWKRSTGLHRPDITLDWINRALTLALLLVAIGFGAKWQSYVSCVASYQDRSASAATARAVAADADRRAQEDMWRAVAAATDPARTPAQAQADFKQALNKFLADRRATEEQRQRNPLPAGPSKVCR